MANKVIVVFSDGYELPMSGPNTDKTLKLPVEEQAKIFYDAATSSKQGKGKTPVTFGREGKEQVPFSKTIKPEVRPPPAPAPVTPAPEVRPTPAPAPVTPAPVPDRVA